jgi:subtilisin family serine protease
MADREQGADRALKGEAGESLKGSWMKRRLFMAVGASALMIVTLVPGGALAKAPPTSDRKIDNLRIDPNFKPAALDLNKRVDVYVKLSGAPVAVAQGVALDRAGGQKLSRATRASIRADLRARQDALKGRISGLGGKVRGQYQDALNAIRVNIAKSRIPALSRLPGVVKVQQVRIHARENVNTDRFIGADKAWAANQGYAGYTGYTGRGIRIAIIDTGVDYYHANFGGSGDPQDFDCDDGLDRKGDNAEECLTTRGVPNPDTFPTNKVVEGYDFVGDCYNASEDPDDPSDPTEECPAGFTDIPNPDPDPLDCDGHGSHVAGTAAGFGVVDDGGPTPVRYTGPYNTTTLSSNQFVIGPGTAPRAKILAYRVFGCEGSTSVVIAALDRAIQDDADVINMSLGSVFGRDDELDSEATNNTSLAGVSVVASAGNSGSSAYITGSPAAATRAISVAALDAVPSFPTAIVDFATEPNEEAINANGGDLTPAITAQLHLFKDNPATTASNVPPGVEPNEKLGCDDAAYTYNATVGYAAGEIAVVYRGVCARVQKAQVGQDNGAVAVIMINTDPGLPPFEGPIEGVTIPFLGVRSTAAPKFVAEDGKTATLREGPVIDNPAYRFLASFTSFGPRNSDSAVKPDVTAPGVSVISTLVGGGTQGTTISGTSMSSPATAGVAALVREAHPGWRPTRVKSAIVGTANSNLLATGEYDVRGAGAGVVQPRRAVDTVTVITTTSGNSNLDFGYEQIDGRFSKSQDATITNVGSTSLTYNLSVAFNKSPLGFTGTVSPSSVTIPAGGKALVRVTLAATKATVAALPDSEVPAPVFTPLTAVRGNLVVTPTTTGPGRYAVRSPFLLAPRAVSGVQAGQKTPYTLFGDTATASIGLINGGIHAGAADVYQWGLSDRNEAYESGDLRAAGAQSFETEDGQLVVFAVNTWGRWSNQSVDEYDILLDTAPCPLVTSGVAPVCEDSDPEYILVTVDFGAIVFGSFDGTTGTFLFRANGSFVSFQGFNPEFPNGSTMIIPFFPEDAGLGPETATAGNGGDTDFNYTVQSSSIVPGSSDDEVTNEAGTGVAWAGFDAWNKALSQGQFIPLDPGEEATLALRVHRSEYFAQENRAKGWMVVTTNDLNGEQQADTIHVGSVPPPAP